MLKDLQFPGFLVYQKVWKDFFVEFFGDGEGAERLTDLLDLKKNSHQNLLDMFTILQFLGFWVYFKVLRKVIHGDGGGGGAERSTELLALKNNCPKNFFG